MAAAKISMHLAYKLLWVASSHDDEQNKKRFEGSLVKEDTQGIRQGILWWRDMTSIRNQVLLQTEVNIRFNLFWLHV